MLSPKVLLISVAVIFTALGVKAALPLATTHLSLIWTFFLLSFTPPYLYFTLNAIIISILASSRFHNSSSSSSFTAQPNLPIHPNYPPSPPPVLEMNTINVNDAASMTKEEEQEEEIKEIDLGMELIKRMDSLEIPPEYLPEMEKPLVSGRFHNQHPKPLKSSLEAAGGKALRSPKPKRNETLENTWKAITEGRSIPLSSRHMKKCDTWHNRCETDPPEPEVMSSNDDEGDRFNFNLAVTSATATATAAKLRRKEPSLSQDELNRRVEEFIHNFNQQMRLQRQRSLDQYLQITNGRGAN